MSIQWNILPPKKNDILIYRTIWLDLENITVNLRNQLQKKKKQIFYDCIYMKYPEQQAL